MVNRLVVISADWKEQLDRLFYKVRNRKSRWDLFFLDVGRKSKLCPAKNLDIFVTNIIIHQLELTVLEWMRSSCTLAKNNNNNNKTSLKINMGNSALKSEHTWIKIFFLNLLNYSNNVYLATSQPLAVCHACAPSDMSTQALLSFLSRQQNTTQRACRYMPWDIPPAWNPAWTMTAPRLKVSEVEGVGVGG